MRRTASKRIHLLSLAGLSLILGVTTALAAWPTDPALNLPVCTAAGTQGWPDAISDGAGGAFIAWQDARDSATTALDIYVQHVSAAGVPLWAANGVAACRAGGDQAFWYNASSAQMVSVGDGSVIVAWEDRRNGYGDIFAQRIDAGGHVAWAENGVAVCTDSQPQYEPLLVTDGSGGAIIMWTDLRLGLDGIYAQRLNTAGTALWTANGRAVVTTPVAQKASAIPDGSGGAIVAWEDYRDWEATGADVYVQHINSSGARQWTGGGYPVVVGPGDQLWPCVIAAPGGPMIFWSDDRNVPDDFDVYGQRIDALGAAQWTANGVAVCVAPPQDQFGPAAVPDAEGGAIVTWEDQRAFPNVHGQRVDGFGATQWGASARLLSTLGRSFATPSLLSDGYGGALIAFSDSRNFPPDWADISAQRIDASGAPMWDPSGATISTAPGAQYLGGLVPGRFGGAIAVWEDHRGDGDIYAQHFDASGVPGGTLDVAPARPILAPSLVVQSANPAHDGVRLVLRLPFDGRVRLGLYDAGGRRVRDLISGWKPRGSHAARWDGRDDAGLPLASGVYFATLEVKGARTTARLALIR
jgi:hypothetical protein